MSRAEARAAARAHRAVARRPPTRTVTVTIAEGEYAGWELTARADFSAGLLVKLEAKTVAEVVEVLDLIVTDHNMPNAAGELAERMADVDPYGGLLALGGALFDKIGRLPPR